ncbi:MAG: DUF1688 family protein [Pseudomonadota bacterium]
MANTDSGEAQDADWLLSPEAIRTQARALAEYCTAGHSEHFAVDRDQLAACADEVVTTIRAAYPTLEVPPHARWRHFVLNGRDRWAERMDWQWQTVAERARRECEVAILSVLLDAGAGPNWRYRDKDGTIFTRSEGLALASLDMFFDGAFGEKAMEVDVHRLASFGPLDLARGFQVNPGNPLEGVAGRAELIANLGKAVLARSDIFGETPRLGGIADRLMHRRTSVPAREILIAVLDALGPIWPGCPVVDGRHLGDCWAHDQAPGPGMVPFHKLSQWLSYSLVEPLQRAGCRVTELDDLTGLAEYRNGGLFLDTGVLALKDPELAEAEHDLDSPLIVEWRALTIVLLDEIADLVRDRLGKSVEEMPLAAVLEGGTWATGRRLAAKLRPGGSPPLAIRSTGTVF